MSIVEELTTAVEEAKNAIYEFSDRRKEFDKIIKDYKELRDKKFVSEKKIEYVGLKKKIKDLEFKKMSFKSAIEDMSNINGKDKFNILVTLKKDALYLNPKSTKEYILLIKKSFGNLVRNIPYDDNKKNNDSYNKEYLKKVSKRLAPLINIIDNYKIGKFENVETKIVTLKSNIISLNNRLLILTQQKDDLKKQTNLYPSASFGYKIAHSEKVDLDKYLKKINNLKLIFETDDFEVSITRAYQEEGRYGNYFKKFESTMEKLRKIKARFERVKNFIDSYESYVTTLTKVDCKDIGRINSIERAMKNLEQEEMTASLKDKQDLAEKLGISKFIQSITQQDVINRADNGTGQIKTSNLTTPNSAFDEGVYWLKTPFKQVRVEVDENSNLMIYPKSKRVAPTYDVISLKLDDIFEGKDNKAVIEKVIDPIINYLKQTVPVPTEALKNQNLLDKIKPMKAVKAERNFLTDKQKEAAAILCGILMLSESHQFRNPTLGKFERSSIKRVKQLTLEGINNPFSVVYANKSGEYINAHAKESDSGFDEARINASYHYYPNEQAVGDGGNKQTHQLLRCKVIDGDMAVNISELPDWIKGIPPFPSKISQGKRIDNEGKHSLRGQYIKIKDLNDKDKGKYKFFEGDRGQTIREFVEK